MFSLNAIAGLDASRLLVGSQTALQQQAAVQAAALRNAAAAAAAPLAGGAPLILSPRLQVPTTLGAGGVMALQAGANGGVSSVSSAAPPPLIAPGDTQGLIYAQYAAAVGADYGNYMSPLLTAADYSDPSGGLFAR